MMRMGRAVRWRLRAGTRPRAVEPCGSRCADHLASLLGLTAEHLARTNRERQIKTRQCEKARSERKKVTAAGECVSTDGMWSTDCERARESASRSVILEAGR